MIKVKKRKILLLPGDGIGPEVVAEVKKIIEWFNKKKCLLNGLDDIALSLDKSKKIDFYEEKIKKTNNMGKNILFIP